MAISLLILNSNIMAQNIKPENDPNILKDIRSFLKVLNSGDGKPVEALAPKDARMVLVNAQKSVAFNYSDVEETEKPVNQFLQLLASLYVLSLFGHLQDRKSVV